MNTVTEIKHAISALSIPQREGLIYWLLESTDAGYRMGSVKEPRIAYDAALPDLLTVEEYFALEDSTSLRYEYVDGVVYAMTGASRAHNLITTELVFILKKHLRGGPCRVFSEALKLRLDTATGRNFYYPDVMVSCDSQGWDTHFIHNPKLIVEVLSPSTRRIDLHEKARSYRELPSIEEYVVASQIEPKVTIYRQAGNWAPQVYAGPEAAAEFRSIGLSVPLAEIYEPALAE